jgi:DNA-binding transcriptional ArsR family regulator
MDIELMRDNAQEASALLKSLANPSRLLVLCALVTREHTVGELEELTGGFSIPWRTPGYRRY